MFHSKKGLKIILAVVMMLVVVFALSCSPSAPATPDQPDKPEPEKVYTMRYSHGLPAQHYIAGVQAAFVEKAIQLSDGQLEIEVYPSAQLYNDRDIVEALATGAVEAGGLYSYVLAPVIPIFEIYNVPGCADSKEQVLGILGGGPIKDKLVAACEAKGLKPIFIQPWGSGGEMAGYAGTGKQIIDLKDQKGKKIRAISAPHVAVVEAGGGHGVFMSGAELYTAMQRGTLDTLSVASAHLIERKLVEVSEWFTSNIPVGADMMSVITVNKAFYDSLPADLQKVLMDAGEAVYQENKLIGWDVNSKYKDMLIEMPDFEVVTLTDEQREEWLVEVFPIIKGYLSGLGPDVVEIFNMCQAHNTKLGLPSSPIE